MITVILPSSESAEAFADTLEDLVPHAVDSFVQEVVLWHEGLDSAHKAMADMAGVNLRKRGDYPLERLCAEARGDWLLFLQSGAQLDEGWVKALSRHAEAGGGPASFRIRFEDDRPLWQRMFAPRTARSPLSGGFAISKSQALSNSRGKDTVDALMRGLSVKTLQASIRPGAH